MADHFRNQLATETTRLTELCDKWDAINNAGDEIPDDVKGEIRSTVGCAHLLMAERFKQFSGLIDNNEFNLGEQPTTEEDLQGFWDLVYLQVEDINKKFVNLDNMQSNEWQEISMVITVPSKPKVIKKKLAKRPEDLNRVRESRRRLAEAKALAAKTLAMTDDLDQEKENVKTFDVPPFFSVSSPVKPPLMKSSSWDSGSSDISKIAITPKKSSPCPKSLLCLSRMSPSLRRALGPIDMPQLQK